MSLFRSFQTHLHSRNFWTYNLSWMSSSGETIIMTCRLRYPCLSPAWRRFKRLFLITRKTILAPIPDGSCLPALESLVLVGCVKLEPDWIGIFLGHLKAQGNFQPSQLTVEGCMWKKSPPEPTLDDPISPGTAGTMRDTRMLRRTRCTSWYCKINRFVIMSQTLALMVCRHLFIILTV